MNDTNSEQAGTAVVEEIQAVKSKTKKEIIHGRMPVACVYLVRFGNTKGEEVKVQADMFGTTVGKITDIRKGSNFAYVTADYRPTEAQVEEATDWLKKHPYYDAAGVDRLILELEAVPLATDDQAKEFDATRSKARAQMTTTKTGEPVTDAGGGNRREARPPKASKVSKEPKASKGPKVEMTAEQAAETADALLA